LTHPFFCEIPACEKIRDQIADCPGSIIAVLFQLVAVTDPQSPVVSVSIHEHRHPVNQFSHRRDDGSPDIGGLLCKRRQHGRRFRDYIPIIVPLILWGDPLVDVGPELLDRCGVVWIQDIVVRLEKCRLLGRWDPAGIFDRIGDPAQEIAETDVCRHRFVEDIDGQRKCPGDALDGLTAPFHIRLIGRVSLSAHSDNCTRQGGIKSPVGWSNTPVAM
jgi:hypothetical protein